MTETIAGDKLPTSVGGIDVWLVFYDEFVDEQQVLALRELLSQEERDLERRFRFADDRKRYLVTRAMVRTVLSRYALVAPAAWQFSVNAYGRPEIACLQNESLGLYFNVSHTRGLIAIGVVRRRALGVDVENLIVRQFSTESANLFFAPDEVVELASVPQDAQQDRFFEHWTLKESYIKARGMGLSIPLERFSILYPQPHMVRMTIQPELGDDAGRWSFWQYRLAQSYVLAICAERLDGEIPKVTIRKMTAAVADEVLEPQLLRVSEAMC